MSIPTPTRPGGRRVGSVTRLRTARKPTSVDIARVRLGLTDCSRSLIKLPPPRAAAQMMALNDAETRVRFLIRYGWVGRTSNPFARSPGFEELQTFG
jgi:hypothetical protein